MLTWPAFLHYCSLVWKTEGVSDIYSVRVAHHCLLAVSTYARGSFITICAAAYRYYKMRQNSGVPF